VLLKRAMAAKLVSLATGFPVVAVTGPRQSGKTTLVRAVMKKHRYVSLETPDDRAWATNDPRGFLARFDGPVIIDEVQKVPDLVSWIQTAVDEKRQPGKFILTGSHNFLLMQGVSQSLAGRCAILHLLPFSLAELAGRPPLNLASPLPGGARPCRPGPSRITLEETLIAGFYPPVRAAGLAPMDWYGSYIQTYVEKDVRAALNVGDIEAFGRFLRLCAGRSGQLMNLSSLASDCGITHTTAGRWLSVLEASFIVILLRPFYRNYGKRLIKAPKLHFLDCGLLCYLLGIHKSDELHTSANRGAIFESMVVSELYKNFANRGERSPLYHWRDAKGHEVDVLADLGSRQVPVEAKSARTVPSDFRSGLDHWRSLAGKSSGRPILVYGGDEAAVREDVSLIPWYAL